jgi:hypothetical protein
MHRYDWPDGGEASVRGVFAGEDLGTHQQDLPDAGGALDEPGGRPGTQNPREAPERLCVRGGCRYDSRVPQIRALRFVLVRMVQ